MKIIGLTGGIGTGKSEVSKVLTELGAVVLDADKIAHQVYLPQTSTWQEIVDAFGGDILKPNNEINRKKLGDIVFKNTEELNRLNSIVHPRIRDFLKMRIDEEREKDIPSVVVDAAIIIEADWLSVVDELWVVISDLDNILERLKLRDGLSREAIMARISTQLAQEERMKYATLTIENNSDLPSLKNKVESLWRNRIMQK
tara:strand:- start:83 stop:682 length:600 start_codon:yes stop_codon:yes gene_type:complete